MSSKLKYPSAFLQRMKNYLVSDFDEFISALDRNAPTSVRINPFKPVSKFDTQEIVSWCANGYYLQERPSFTFDPLFHAGTYYVQEASSMFVEEIWNELHLKDKTLRVLDMCAAPGGKSTHLVSLMNKDSLLVSNEVIPNRNKILRENITKWGTANVIVTQNKPEDFADLINFFDVILVDAPCSGEGMFRKDKTAVEEWSEKNVSVCAARQTEILNHAVSCLKPGGFLIYSTCTFAPEEDDLQIEKCIKQLAIDSWQLAAKQDGIVSTKYGVQFFPHKVKGEGFYIAVLQNQGSSPYSISPVKNTGKTSEILSHYLQNAQNFVEYKKNDRLYAIPQNLYADFLFLEKHLYIRQAGICMGTLKGKDFLPAHDLALSIHVKSNIPFCNLTYDEAITYLRSESFKLTSELRGWCLARFEQKNLGWIKLMDGRMNNYYPKELRILKPSP